MEIKDSGTRREFESGAVRDCAEGKGRFDLMPLRDLYEITFKDKVIKYLGYAQEQLECDGKEFGCAMISAAMEFIENEHLNPYECLLGLAKHFENGAKKYDEDNWKKGIPLKNYLDSACRHYCKYKAGWDDEDHLSAFLWNCICGAWTAVEIHGEYRDY